MTAARWRVVLAAIAWFATLAWVFMLFTAQWTAVNWIGAGALAAVATACTVPLVARGLFRVRFERTELAQLPSVAKQIPLDFWIVTVALARSIAGRRRTVGCFVARGDFPAGGDDARGRAWRAAVTVLSTWSPNSYVVDIDAESGNRLSHDLVPRRDSERPA